MEKKSLIHSPGQIAEFAAKLDAMFKGDAFHEMQNVLRCSVRFKTFQIVHDKHDDPHDIQGKTGRDMYPAVFCNLHHAVVKSWPGQPNYKALYEYVKIKPLLACLQYRILKMAPEDLPRVVAKGIDLAKSGEQTAKFEHFSALFATYLLAGGDLRELLPSGCGG